MKEHKFFRSNEEFFDCLEVLRGLRKKGIIAAWIHGSTVKGKGPDHRDIDIYVQQDNHLPGVHALASGQMKIGCVKSGTDFDVVSSLFPMGYSSFDEEDKNAARLVFARKKIPSYSRIKNHTDIPQLALFL